MCFKLVLLLGIIILFASSIVHSRAITDLMLFGDCTPPTVKSPGELNCTGNGICIPSPDGNGHYCDCKGGFTGDFCSQRIKQELGGCLNGGVQTKNVYGQTQCSCPQNWTGPICAELVIEDGPKLCHNGGKLILEPKGNKCNCTAGFSGDDCKLQINECDPMPCGDGGTCIDKIGGFECICPPERSGLYCQILHTDLSTICIDTTLTTPHKPIGYNSQQNQEQSVFDHNGYRYRCLCKNGHPDCTILWYGLPKCFDLSNTNNSCKTNEKCVPHLSERCLNAPCTLHGYCSNLVSPKPPKFPVPDCLPNNATVSNLCALLTIDLYLRRIPKDTSIESFCNSLRSYVDQHDIGLNIHLVLICDIEKGRNDSIALTVSTTDRGLIASSAIRKVTQILQDPSAKKFNKTDELLSSILNVKINTSQSSPNAATFKKVSPIVAIMLLLFNVLNHCYLLFC